ncbi:MAG TPA: PEP/pyruvate-binding domain-containing protein [Candidatus Brocadiia bacterium]|nr:PEP/pyruvate-binding domain-containing protein [Candidatus Brocadiia bacterium]
MSLPIQGWTTGIKGLDEILHGLRAGDNIVWITGNIEDFTVFVEPFYKNAVRAGRKTVYFRFANHKPLVPPDAGVEIVELQTEAGFESFITQIHKTIKRVGLGGHYIFDSLSAIAEDFYSDRMIGNFFQLTCPYLYALETIAYFPIFRDYHSYHAMSPISETTQLLLDIYGYEDKLYVYPLKIDGRYPPTIHMLHAWEGDKFRPVMESSNVSDVFGGSPWPGLKSASYRMVGVWDRRFMASEDLLAAYRRGEVEQEDYDKRRKWLIRLMISRDPRVQELSSKYFELEDLIYIWKRMIGSGMIGGKSVGMLLSRAILQKKNPKWKERLESHDSFFIGSDVFYSFLVLNDCWWERQKQKDPANFLDGIEEMRSRILRGKFPDYIMQRFADMIEYFGQAPIIVRSSSFLEDNFSNAFAGKYESVFCANRGTHEQRLQEFLAAVRTVYASTVSVEALTYRAKRGVLEKDEQMALLVQRVSGAPHGDFFYPQVAGVGFSFNPYVWNSQIDPKAGMLRLVFGLGTRAVDRHDDDYTRVVALNAPELRPEANFDELRRYAQHKIDVLNLRDRAHQTLDFYDIAGTAGDVPLGLYLTTDGNNSEPGGDDPHRGLLAGALTFREFLRETTFVDDMRDLMSTIQETYECPVDVEYTANVLPQGSLKIDLLQCRPLQAKGFAAEAAPTVEIPPERLIMEARGAVIGESRFGPVERLVYVAPSEYSKLPNHDRYALAKLIGRITHIPGPLGARSIMLIGPGRWGTSTPALGIPVSFTDINTISVLCEIVGMRDDLVPDISLGTHFFSDLIEMDILYTAYFPMKAGNSFKTEFFYASPNRLGDLLPNEARWSNVVRVVDARQFVGQRIRLRADCLKQNCAVYIE